MIYLTEDDLEVIITDYTLSDLLETTGNTIDSPILQNAERTAVDIVFSYITNVYDKDIELAKTGTTRDYMIVNSISTVTQNLLYQRVSTDIIPQHIDMSFERIIENLVNIQNRKLNPILTKKETDDTTYVPRVVSSSNTPRTNYSY